MTRYSTFSKSFFFAQIKLLVLSFLLFACGATVAVDYDQKVDFTQYRSYNFYPSIESGLTELDDSRIMKITDSLLQESGFQKSETPQLYINYYAQESVSNSRSTLGIGVGSGGGNVGVGVSGGIPIGGRVINQQLTVDFIDSAQDQMIWQAIAEGEMKERATPQQKEAYYIALLKKMLNSFPPSK